MYRWFYKCNNCGRTWSSHWEFEKNKQTNLSLCPCGCIMIKVSDVERMRKEGIW